MAIEKDINPTVLNEENQIPLGNEGMQIALNAIEEAGTEDFVMQDDGSAILESSMSEPRDTGFDENLAEAMDDSELMQIANEFFTNYSIATTNRELGIEVKELMTISDVKDKWAKSFVEVFKCVGGVPVPFLPINEAKSNIFKPFILPYKKEHVRNIAEAQMVSNMTFLNLQLGLDNIGDTIRKPGKFIDIFKRNDQVEIVDDKLLGRWFVTKVRHTFQRDRYSNVISCIKTCVGPDAERKGIE